MKYSALHLGLLGALVLGVVLVRLTAIPAEDAVMLYEYAKNLASQGVITYGAKNTVPVEGATDFLWMICIAILAKAGLNEYSAALGITVVATVLLFQLLVARGIPSLLVGASIATSGYFVSALHGFSTIAFSALYVLCLALAARKDRRTYFAVLFLCLLRPDGVVWAAGVLAMVLLSVNRSELRGHLRDLILFLVIPGAIYFVWRVSYFGEWLPLSFLVKAAGARDLLIFYRYSLASVEWAAVPLVVTLVAASAPRGLLLRALLLFVLPAIFYGAMRLEQNTGNRFLAPMFFGGLFLVSQYGRTRALVAFVLLSAYLAWFQPYIGTLDTVKSLANSRRENVYSVARDLGSLQGKMLVTEAGRLAYYSGWQVDDSWGLNTPRFARRLIDTADLVAGQYDLISAHCELSLLTAAPAPKPDRSRSWENHCAVLVDYIRNNDYEVVLVPFYRGLTLGQKIRTHLNVAYEFVPDQCERYDIFAISHSYSDLERILALLMAHGAQPYAQVKQKIVGDSLCSH